MTIETTAIQNPAETMREVMEQIGLTETLAKPTDTEGGTPFTAPHVVTVTDKRSVHDLTSHHRQAAEYLKPARRKGTAYLRDLDSLVAWTNRFKGENSVLFANPDIDKPSLTCIADYHLAGAPDATNPMGEPTARHGHHRAIYNFPLSKEWQAWLNVSDKPMGKDDLGEFIEANAKDIMDPTPAILAMKEDEANEPWENRMILTAQKIEGRFGQLHQLLAMSKQFQIYETSNLTVSTNRDTGESEIQFLNEHKTKDGKPLNIPNLLMIAIPAFLNGAPYRMAVRFRYRKMGGEVKFILSLYNPEKVFDAAFDEAVTSATEQTGLLTLTGTPES